VKPEGQVWHVCQVGIIYSYSLTLLAVWESISHIQIASTLSTFLYVGRVYRARNAMEQ
jgi:hypothetical protein